MSNWYYTATQSGSYTITAVYGGCPRTSSPKVLEVKEAPSVPVISGGYYNTCPATSVQLDAGGDYYAYQWYMNGSPMPSATGRTYNAVVTGNYSVRVWASSGCNATSASHTVFIDFCPNSEVSPLGSMFPLRITKDPASPTGYYLHYQRIDTVDGFNVYEGQVGMYYSHGGQPGNFCSAPFEDLGTGEIRVAVDPSDGNSYFLVTAFYGADEGPSGYDSSNGQIPASQSTCAP